MKEQIASLTPEQAQRALLFFYEISPDDLWEGQKPSQIDIKAWVEELQEEAPVEIQPFLTTLLNEPDQLHRGEIAKILLSKFAEYPPLLPHVEKAATRATEPCMAPLPVVMGALILALAVLPKEIKTEKVHIKIGHLKEAAEFVGKLIEFINALPGKLQKWGT
jgi:hypothetical protein